MAATLNFSFANNVGRRLRIEMVLNGEPWDIASSGYNSARMDIRSPADADRAALTLSTDAKTLIFDSTALVIDIHRGLALGVPPGGYTYDVLFFHPTERPRRPVSGLITVVQGITR